MYSFRGSMAQRQHQVWWFIWTPHQDSRHLGVPHGASAIGSNLCNHRNIDRSCLGGFHLSDNGTRVCMS